MQSHVHTCDTKPSKHEAGNLLHTVSQLQETSLEVPLSIIPRYKVEMQDSLGILEWIRWAPLYLNFPTRHFSCELFQALSPMLMGQVNLAMQLLAQKAAS